MKAPSFVHLVLLLLSLTAAAQFQPLTFTRGPDNVALQWQGGIGPWLIETSRDLTAWSDQGEPAAGRSRTLSAFGTRSFYRITDLNSTDTFGPFFGLIQTDQGEFGGLLARHRLKSRLWLYKTKGAPHTSPSFTAANWFRKLIVLYQYHDAGRVRTWTGPLENLGTVATPTTQRMTVSWTRGSGASLQTFVLTLDFPYTVNTARTAAPQPSDPDYELRCTRATAEPELDGGTMTLASATVDTVGLYQLDPDNANLSFPPARQYRVTDRGAHVDLHFQEGLPLMEGFPPFIFKTFILDRWLSPSTGGGTLPAFSTDSYFSRTLLPGHHNFVETVLLEPALDPALAETTRAALQAANIRYIYTFKDLDIGVSPDDIRYFGFDNSVRDP
jgi:hypothetical protein